MNVPKLRFPEFHDEWKKVKISSIVSESKMKTGNIEKYPLWSLTIESGITPKTDRYERSFLVKKDDNYKIVGPNNYVYNPMNVHLGAIGRNKSGQSISVSGYYDVFSINNNFYGFYDNYFISPVMFKKYKLISTGSLLEKQRVHYSQFKELEIYLPINKEQEKIGKFFLLLDKKIELQSKKIETLKLFKKGLLNKLINDSNGYPIKLEKIFNIFAGGTPSTSNHDYWNGNIKWIQSGLIQNNIINDNMIKTSISIEGLKHSSAKLIKPNTTLLAMTGATCGNTAFLTCSATANQSVMAFESSKCNNKYLYYLFQNNKNYILKFQAGGAQSGINKNSCKNMIFSFPPLEDQNKIVNVLDAYENMIILRIKQLNMLKELKKGLMQNMLI